MKNIARERLEREIIEISEREQCRLGQDLHDGLGQELAGVAMLAAVLANQLKAESHPCGKAAADIAAYTKDAIDSMRQLARGLYPIELERNGLLPALEDLANQTSLRYGVRCELRQSGEPPCFEKPAEFHLYRIVQESVGNAIKHGKAGSITIESHAGDGVHTFNVVDDGLGFVTPPPAGSGMGLHLMDYRARAIGAVVDVTSPADGGCRVSCRLPCYGSSLS